MLVAQEYLKLQNIIPKRSQKLFSEFLPKGYRLTTLNSVLEKDKVIKLKVMLGTLITLYDDFADRPDQLNPRLLSLLYRVPFEKIEIENGFLSENEKRVFKYSKNLFSNLFDSLENLPNYRKLIELFKFDLKQFFLSNYYCELLTQTPYLSNRLENRLYLHHNMGIVMAGMIDLMSLENFDFRELGKARVLFVLGQRAGRISNVLTTIDRELEEGDITNELLAYKYSSESILKESNLKDELIHILENMNQFNNIKSFSAIEYSKGIKSLYDLHVDFSGVI